MRFLCINCCERDEEEPEAFHLSRYDSILKTTVMLYFNSTNVNVLLAKLTFLKENDPEIYGIFERILSNMIVLYNGCPMEDKHSAMAGIPVALSDNTIRKMKAKIKRKAEALRRWQRKKGLKEIDSYL